MTHYQILGINKNALVKEIKAAYHWLARLHHPDKGGDPEKFKEIQEAYEILSNGTTRKEYDKKISANISSEDNLEEKWKREENFSYEQRLGLNSLNPPTNREIEEAFANKVNNLAKDTKEYNYYLEARQILNHWLTASNNDEDWRYFRNYDYQLKTCESEEAKEKWTKKYRIFLELVEKITEETEKNLKKYQVKCWITEGRLRREGWKEVNWKEKLWETEISDDKTIGEKWLNDFCQEMMSEINWNLSLQNSSSGTGSSLSSSIRKNVRKRFSSVSSNEILTSTHNYPEETKIDEADQEKVGWLEEKLAREEETINLLENEKNEAKELLEDYFISGKKIKSEDDYHYELTRLIARLVIEHWELINDRKKLRKELEKAEKNLGESNEEVGKLADKVEDSHKSFRKMSEEYREMKVQLKKVKEGDSKELTNLQNRFNEVAKNNLKQQAKISSFKKIVKILFPVTSLQELDEKDAQELKVRLTFFEKLAKTIKTGFELEEDEHFFFNLERKIEEYQKLKAELEKKSSTTKQCRKCEVLLDSPENSLIDICEECAREENLYKSADRSPVKQSAPSSPATFRHLPFSASHLTGDSENPYFSNLNKSNPSLKEDSAGSNNAIFSVPASPYAKPSRRASIAALSAGVFDFLTPSNSRQPANYLSELLNKIIKKSDEEFDGALEGFLQELNKGKSKTKAETLKGLIIAYRCQDKQNKVNRETIELREIEINETKARMIIGFEENVNLSRENSELKEELKELKSTNKNSLRSPGLPTILTTVVEGGTEDGTEDGTMLSFKLNSLKMLRTSSFGSETGTKSTDNNLQVRRNNKRLRELEEVRKELAATQKALKLSEKTSEVYANYLYVYANVKDNDEELRQEIEDGIKEELKKLPELANNDENELLSLLTNEELKRRIFWAKEKEDSWAEHLNRLIDENEILQSTLNELQDDNDEQRRIYLQNKGKWKQEFENLKREIEQERQQKFSIYSEYHNSRNRNFNLFNYLKKLEIEQDNLTGQEIKKLKTELRKNKNELEKSTKQPTSLNNYREFTNKLEKEKEELVQKFSELETELADKETKAKTLTNDLNTANTQIDNLASQLTLTNTALTNTQKQLVTVTETKAKVEQALASLTNEHQNIQFQQKLEETVRKDLINKLKLQEQELKDLVMAKEELAQANEALKEQSQAIIEGHREAVNSLTANHSASEAKLKVKISRLTEQVTKRPTNANYRALELVKRELEEEKARFTEELDTLQKDKDKTDNDLVIEQGKVSNLTNDLASANTNVTALTGQLQAEQAKVNTLTGQLIAEVNAHQATQANLVNTQQQLTTTERNLGINSVSDIPTIMSAVPTGITLQQLVNAYNSLPAQVSQAHQVQLQAERDRDNKEKVITTKLITELDLSIEKDSSLEEVIANLKKLLDKTPMEEIKAQLNKANQIIKGLKEQLSLVNKDDNGQLLKEQNTLINKELSQLKNSQQTERGFFIASLAVSLITIGGLVKNYPPLFSQKKKNKNNSQKYY